MHPILFHIGPLTIYTYGAMVALGFLAACVLVRANHAHAGISKDKSSDIVLWGVVAGLIGARIFYVIQFWDQFSGGNWLDIFKIYQGGLVFYGGFILAFIVLLIFCRLRKLSILAVMDVVAPALAAGHAFGRIGCFFNGCCFGKATDAFCAVSYPVGSRTALTLHGAAVHPVQLYEAGFDFILAAILFGCVRKLPRGVAMGIYLIAYGLWRFVIEYFRADNPVYGSLTAAQWIGIGMVPAGVGILVYVWIMRYRKDSSACGK